MLVHLCSIFQWRWALHLGAPQWLSLSQCSSSSGSSHRSTGQCHANQSFSQPSLSSSRPCPQAELLGAAGQPGAGADHLWEQSTQCHGLQRAAKVTHVGTAVVGTCSRQDASSMLWGSMAMVVFDGGSGAPLALLLGPACHEGCQCWVGCGSVLPSCQWTLQPGFNRKPGLQAASCMRGRQPLDWQDTSISLACTAAGRAT
jgi:hypothetical protein